MTRVIALLVVVAIGCENQQAVEYCGGNGASIPIGAPAPIPGSANMTTVIGPIAPNLNKWGPDNGNLPFSWPGRAVQIDMVNPQKPEEHLIYEVRLPEGSNLHKVHVWVDPSDGHDSVPANRAGASLWVHNGGFVESGMLASSFTLGDSVANYEQRYLLTMDLTSPLLIQADERVFVYVNGEWGQGSRIGLTVDTPEIVYSE